MYTEPITLEAGLTHDTQFMEWADQVNNPQGDGDVSLKNYRKEVIVSVHNDTADEDARTSGHG